MDVVDKVVLLMISATVIPLALGSFKGTNTTGWSTEEVALWGIITILIIVSVIRMVRK